MVMIGDLQATLSLNTAPFQASAAQATTTFGSLETVMQANAQAATLLGGNLGSVISQLQASSTSAADAREVFKGLALSGADLTTAMSAYAAATTPAAAATGALAESMQAAAGAAHLEGEAFGESANAARLVASNEEAAVRATQFEAEQMQRLAAASFEASQAERGVATAAESVALAEREAAAASQGLSGILQTGVQLAAIGAAYEVVNLTKKAIEMASGLQTAETNLANFAQLTTADAQAIGASFQTGFGLGINSARDLTAALAPASRILEDVTHGSLSVADAGRVMTASQNLAAASGDKLNSATMAVALTLRTFSLDASQAAHVSDVLLDTAQRTGVSVGNLATQFGRMHEQLGPLAPTLDETAAILDRATEAGMNGGRAVLSLTTAFEHLESGNKAANAELKTLGVNLTDSHGKLLNFDQVMGQLMPKLDAMSPAEQKVAEQALFGATGFARLWDVLSNGETPAQMAIDNAKRLADAHEQGARHAATFTGAMERVGTAVENVGASFGKYLIGELYKMMSDVIQLEGIFADFLTVLEKIPGAHHAIGTAGEDLQKTVQNEKAGLDAMTKSLDDNTAAAKRNGAAVVEYGPPASLAYHDTGEVAAVSAEKQRHAADLITQAQIDEMRGMALVAQDHRLEAAAILADNDELANSFHNMARIAEEEFHLQAAAVKRDSAEERRDLVDLSRVTREVEAAMHESRLAAIKGEDELAAAYAQDAELIASGQAQLGRDVVDRAREAQAELKAIQDQAKKDAAEANAELQVHARAQKAIFDEQVTQAKGAAELVNLMADDTGAKHHQVTTQMIADDVARGDAARAAALTAQQAAIADRDVLLDLERQLSTAVDKDQIASLNAQITRQRAQLDLDQGIANEEISIWKGARKQEGDDLKSMLEASLKDWTDYYSAEKKLITDQQADWKSEGDFRRAEAKKVADDLLLIAKFGADAEIAVEEHKIDRMVQNEDKIAIKERAAIDRSIAGEEHKLANFQTIGERKLDLLEKQGKAEEAAIQRQQMAIEEERARSVIALQRAAEAQIAAVRAQEKVDLEAIRVKVAQQQKLSDVQKAIYTAALLEEEKLMGQIHTLELAQRITLDEKDQQSAITTAAIRANAGDAAAVAEIIAAGKATQSALDGDLARENSGIDAAKTLVTASETAAANAVANITTIKDTLKDLGAQAADTATAAAASIQDIMDGLANGIADAASKADTALAGIGDAATSAATKAGGAAGAAGLGGSSGGGASSGGGVGGTSHYNYGSLGGSGAAAASGGATGGGVANIGPKTFEAPRNTAQPGEGSGFYGGFPQGPPQYQVTVPWDIRYSDGTSAPPVPSVDTSGAIGKIAIFSPGTPVPGTGSPVWNPPAAAAPAAAPSANVAVTLQVDSATVATWVGTGLQSGQDMRIPFPGGLS